jgi:hypothetical protein
MKTDFKTMQLAIEALIKKAANLSDIEVISEERKDLISAIDTALSQLGMAIVIQTVDAKVSKPNLPGPVFDALEISVLVHENVLINRDQSDRTAHAVAKDIAEALHQKSLEGSGGLLLCKGIFYQPESRVLTYSVDFKTGE